MAKQTYRGVSRARRVTKSEAAKYRKVREQVEAEFPPAKPAPVKVAIAKLRAMRQAKGITLAELAAHTGMTRGNIARLESQKTQHYKRSSATPLDSTANWKSMSSQPTLERKRNARLRDKKNCVPFGFSPEP